MSKLFEEDCTAESLAALIIESVAATPSEADSHATRIGQVSWVDAGVAVIAEVVAKEVGKLAKATEAVPTDVPLMFAGLNSITLIQLHFWLQSEYDYEEGISRLFEEDVTAEVVARDIHGILGKAEVTLTPVPAPVVVRTPPVKPEPVKETRTVSLPAPLNLKSSAFVTATHIPAAMKTGDLKATGLPTG